MNTRKTKKLAVLGMLCALAYIAAAVLRFPVVLFLRYDPKDIVIAIAGLAYGPAAAAVVTLVVSAAQLFTVSGTGLLGCLMNVVSSCAFACPAALLYRRRPGFARAARGLACGWLCQIAGMMLWNYWIAPVYMGVSRAEMVPLLFTAFLPFNVMKGGLNAAATLILWRYLQAFIPEKG